MPTEHVAERSDLEIAAAHHLPRIPVRPVLAFEFLLAERRGGFGEMAAVDHDVRPRIAQPVRQAVARNNLCRERACQRWVHHVTREVPAGCLLHESPDVARNIADSPPLLRKTGKYTLEHSDVLGA